MPALPADKLAIVVPAYRSLLDPLEAVSLESTFRVLGRHHLVLAKPAGLDTAAIEARFPFKAVETFDPTYFTSIQGYNRLLLSTEFYQRFLGSAFVLICQLDVFVFRDDLARWVAAGHDYVGAPWVSRSALGTAFHGLKMVLGRLLPGAGDRVFRYQTRNRVGNGGFSLRAVALHHQLSISLRPRIERYLARAGSHHFNEDIFWSIEPSRQGLRHRTPTLEEALDFAWDTRPERLYALTGGRLPMAAHGWFKGARLDFWGPHVEAAMEAPPIAAP
jgi:hypothetical protein